jgi:hypothetical protein
VALGGPGPQRQFELADPAAGPALAQSLGEVQAQREQLERIAGIFPLLRGGV